MIKRTINFIKRDFSSVSEAMNYLCKRELPKGILILYYACVLPLGLLSYPLVKIWGYWYLRKIDKQIRKWDEA